jgi:hypothetical protein
MSNALRIAAVTDALNCARMRVTEEQGAIVTAAAYREGSQSHLFAVSELAYQQALVARLEAKLETLTRG